MAPLPNYAHLLPPSWKTQVTAWIAEDTPSFDYGGFVVGEAEREAFLFGKGTQRAVLAGVPFFNEVFEQLGCTYALSNVPLRHMLTICVCQSGMEPERRRGI